MKLNAKEANRISMASESQFNSYIERIEESIRSRAKGGYRMDSHTFSSNTDYSFRDKVITELVVFGYTVKGKPSSDLIEINW